MSTAVDISVLRVNFIFVIFSDNSDSEDSDDIVIGSTASLRKDLPRSDKKGQI